MMRLLTFSLSLVIPLLIWMAVIQLEKVNMGISVVNMVISIVEIKATTETRDELRRALSSLSGPTEAEIGCTSCELYQGVSDASVFRVESKWKETGDLLRHIRSENYRRLLLLMELGSEEPSVEFYRISELRGLDFIRAARERVD